MGSRRSRGEDRKSQGTPGGLIEVAGWAKEGFGVKCLTRAFTPAGNVIEGERGIYVGLGRLFVMREKISLWGYPGGQSRAGLRWLGVRHLDGWGSEDSMYCVLRVNERP